MGGPGSVVSVKIARRWGFQLGLAFFPFFSHFIPCLIVKYLIRKDCLRMKFVVRA